MKFSDDQYDAARSFAHTMIVVDDEPVDETSKEKVTSDVVRPSRLTASKAAANQDPPKRTLKDRHSHSLDAKTLIKSALELGLVCSVVNPSGDEDNVAEGVAKASTRADIISLDWHMRGDDDGDLACKIIEEIIRRDEAIGGRLRLIAIYTGDKRQATILKKIKSALSPAGTVKIEDFEGGKVLTNATGLRLVWRHKALQNKKLKGAVLEADLPKNLLTEFSCLSAGLLSNVALATISSMRDSTHHVLSKFLPELDGPYFHHRALLENSYESMDYAVSIVMSALKSEIDKSQVTEKFTTKDAIRRRLEVLSNGQENFTLRYLQKDAEKEFNFSLEEVLTMIENGHLNWPAEILDGAKARPVNSSNGKPSKSNYKGDFSTVFTADRASAYQDMMHFSFLTNSSSSELTKTLRKNPPKLELGSVIYSRRHGYLLCLQATCDAVRGDGSFFFIPLDETDGRPDIVVPHKKPSKKQSYIGLSIPAKCYTKSVSLKFDAIDKELARVPVAYDEAKGTFHVKDQTKTVFRWLGNLKYKRALRVAQDVSQQMSRIGFDEFEPFKN